MKYNGQTYRNDLIKTSDGRFPEKLPGGRLLCITLLVIAIPLLQCKEPYISPYVSPSTGYLVVEGYISGNRPTSFMLSRTIKLSADTTNPTELGANVQVEGNDNSVSPLAELGGGVYSTPAILSLNTSVKYRLRIHTQSGGEYLSDYAPYKITPAIDSINWVENDEGVIIYANAHNDAGTTRYYGWSYGETWEYHSAEESELMYDPSDSTLVNRPPQDQIYTCWHGDSSSNILIASTERLSQDVLYEYPLRQIPSNSIPLTILYSILVRQYALTDSGYIYLGLMQKNTESLGSIFDPQPSQLYGGNIHSLTNSNEPVIGYISAGTVQQQRIFISNSELSDWNYSFSCPIADQIFTRTPPPLYLGIYFNNGPYTALYYGMYGLMANYPSCVDCRVMSGGGTTNKPAFWPN